MPERKLPPLTNTELDKLLVRYGVRGFHDPHVLRLVAELRDLGEVVKPLLAIAEQTRTWAWEDEEEFVLITGATEVEFARVKWGVLRALRKAREGGK